MYSNDVIQELTKRIGFGNEYNADVVVTAENRIGTSGRTFAFYHRLVTIPNLYFTVPAIGISDTDFNELLEQMKYDAVIGALTSVLNQSLDYIDAFDYDSIIQDKFSLFDNVIGYQMAITAIELMVSSNRKNDEERNANLTYSQLKMELEGIRNDNGHLVSQGLLSKFQNESRKLRNIIFPPLILVKGSNNWNLG